MPGGGSSAQPATTTTSAIQVVGGSTLAGAASRLARKQQKASSRCGRRGVWASIQPSGETALWAGHGGVRKDGARGRVGGSVVGDPGSHMLVDFPEEVLVQDVVRLLQQLLHAGEVAGFVRRCDGHGALMAPLPHSPSLRPSL